MQGKHINPYKTQIFKFDLENVNRSKLTNILKTDLHEIKLTLLFIEKKVKNRTKITPK